VAVLSAPLTAGTVYSFTSFDGPGKNAGGTTVNGINNNGDAVGFASDNAATPTLFTNFIRNPDGTLTLLTLGGDPLAMANGINDSRTVVGGNSSGTAFLLPGGTPITLAKVNGTTVFQTAFGINDAGLIAGQYTDGATDTTPGFLFNGAYINLTPTVTATATNAQGVNIHGLVTGFYSADGVHQHGFLYDSTKAQFTLLADPSVANLVLTQFLGINDSGLAVGYYQTNDGSQHGLLYNTTTSTYTFLDDPSSALKGVSITQITGVNDSGEIAGFYVDATSGLQRGFIATPVSSPVPEPPTSILLPGSLISILVAGRRIRRRR
jgi:hypothetical protein